MDDKNILTLFYYFHPVKKHEHLIQVFHISAKNIKIIHAHSIIHFYKK